MNDQPRTHTELFPQFDAIMQRGGNRDLQLRDVVIRLRKEGRSKPLIEEALIDYLRTVGSDDDEDVIRDVLDYLVGHCSPHLAID